MRKTVVEAATASVFVVRPLLLALNAYQPPRSVVQHSPSCNKMPSKRISYIKKVKEEKKDENSDIEMLAINLELSKREIEQYIAFKERLSN